MEETSQGQADERSFAAALHNISEFGTWIANADTKAGLVAAALAVVLSGLALQRDRVDAAVRGVEQQSLPLVVLLLLIVLVAVTGMFVLRTILPRTAVTWKSRFAWPTVRDVPVEELMDTNEDRLQREAWQQCAMLADVAGRKFKSFKGALYSFGGVIIVYLSWMLISSGL